MKVTKRTVLTRVNRVSPSSSTIFPKLSIRCSPEIFGKQMIPSALHVTESFVKATIFVETVTTETKVAILKASITEVKLSTAINTVEFGSKEVFDGESKGTVHLVIISRSVGDFIVSIATKIF